MLSAGLVRRLRLLGVATFCGVAAMRLCDPMLPALAREFQASDAAVAQVVSAYALTYGVFQFLYGPLGDRIGKTRVILMACAGSSLATVAAACATSLGWLVAGRVFMAAAAAGIGPVAMAWLGDNVEYGQRQAVLARLLTATVSGFIVGQFGAGLAADTLGWRAAFWVLALAFAVAAVLLWRDMRIEPRPASAQASSTPLPGVLAAVLSPLRLLGDARARSVVAITALEGALSFGALAFVPSLLVQRFGFSLTGAGATATLFGVGGLLYTRVAGRLVGSVGERGLLVAGATGSSLALLALALAPWPAAGAPACLVFGVGFHMMHNTLQTRASQIAPQARGTAMSLFACALALGQALGVTAVAAGFASGGMGPTFAAVAVVLLAVGAAAAADRRFQPPTA